MMTTMSMMMPDNWAYGTVIVMGRGQICPRFCLKICRVDNGKNESRIGLDQNFGERVYYLFMTYCAIISGLCMVCK